MYVQYGCGFNAPKEWLNFDASLTLKWERIPVFGRVYTKNSQRFPPNVRWGNIVAGLPLQDRTCRGVYASHVLEHLALEDFHQALANTRRILRDGGTFRLIVPDLEWAAREYIRRSEAGDRMANDFLLTETGLGRKEPRPGLAGLAYEWLRTSRHLWMWDALSLGHALEKHGFRQIRRCGFHDSEDPMFALVEDKNRFEHAIAMEARA